MEGCYHVSLRWYIMSLWTLVVILLMFPNYSESACVVSNCNLSQCSGSNCNGCNDGYYLQYGSSCIQCELSIPGCATCSSSTSCTKCKDGYYLQSGSCIQCQLSIPGCATCSSSTSCTKCKDGYYLQSGSCFLCPVRCSTCTSSTQCTTCKDTYWNLPGGCFLTCSTNCTNNVCDDTTGYCNLCKPGTYGPQCGQDCNLCKDGQCDLRKCTNGCKDGYYQYTIQSGYSYCYKCVYDNCLTCSNVTYCTKCEQGYYRNYFRLDTGGRGRINCIQCFNSCLDCTSTDHCHEDCIQHCDVSVKPGTTKSTKTTNHERIMEHTAITGSTKSTQKSTTIRSTTSKILTSKTEPPTQSQKTSESIKSTESTPQEDCHYVNGELYKKLNSCQQRIKTYSESEDQYQLTFGHGLATGIGITIVLFGSGVGIALFIRRQTEQHKYADENSEGRHEYVNTNMTDILSVISSANNEVNNDIHTVSSDLTNTEVTNIESSRDYVMLGDRPTHESDYTDLQNT